LGIVCVLVAEVSRQGESQPEGKHTVFRLKGAQTAVTLGNTLDAFVSAAMAFLLGNRKAIAYDNLTGIGVLDLEKEFVLLDLTTPHLPS